MRKTLPAGALIAVALTACSPSAPSSRVHAPKEGDPKGVLVFAAGEAGAEGLDYLGAALAEKGWSVTLLDGAAGFEKPMLQAMRTDSCTSVGAFGAAVPTIAEFAKTNAEKAGVDGALMIAGLIDSAKNYAFDNFIIRSVFAEHDPATAAEKLLPVGALYPGGSSFATIAGANRSGLVMGASFTGDGAATTSAEEQRAALIDAADYALGRFCDRRQELIDEAKKRAARGQ